MRSGVSPDERPTAPVEVTTPPPPPPQSTARQPESLATLLGGKRGAIDATVPPLAFVAGFLLWRESVPAGAAAAVAAAAVIAAWRIYRRQRLRAALVGLLAVAVAALIALRTGRASDFFLIQVASNAASALAWMTSIAIRWPLLGVVVAGILRQRTQWRRDPALLHAYSRGSAVWIGQYVTRVTVFVPLWLADQAVALGIARAALSWPLVAATIALSWPVVQRSLPQEHPGLRHPVISQPVPPAQRTGSA